MSETTSSSQTRREGGVVSKIIEPFIRFVGLYGPMNRTTEENNAIGPTNRSIEVAAAHLLPGYYNAVMSADRFMAGRKYVSVQYPWYVVASASADVITTIGIGAMAYLYANRTGDIGGAFAKALLIKEAYQAGASIGASYIGYVRQIALAGLDALRSTIDQ